MNRYVGNLPPIPGVFPDYPAPVVRYARAERELMTMCWEMPPPPRTGGYSGTPRHLIGGPGYSRKIARAEHAEATPAGTHTSVAILSPREDAGWGHNWRAA